MASITVSKTVHAGSNPASPAHKERTGIQIIAGVSVFFVVSMPNNQLDIHIEHVWGNYRPTISGLLVNTS